MFVWLVAWAHAHKLIAAIHAAKPPGIERLFISPRTLMSCPRKSTSHLLRRFGSDGSPQLPMNRAPSPHPSPPNGGEGARLVRRRLDEGGRPGEGDSRFMAPTHVRILEVFATHEPGRLRVGDPRSGPRLCEAQRFIVPIHARSERGFP